MNQNDFESFNRGLIVTKCCGQWRQFDEDYDNNNNNAFDVNDARWKLSNNKFNSNNKAVIITKYLKKIFFNFSK